MNQFLEMNIFFFVTTIAIVLVIVGGGFLFWRVMRILGHLEHIADQAAAESDSLRLDLAKLRADLRLGAGRLGSLFGLVRRTRRARDDS